MKLSLKKAQQMMAENKCGDLNIYGSSITELPRGLIVPGSLWARSSKLTALPKDISIGGCIDVSYTNITELPEGLIVPGSLWVEFSKLTAIPKDVAIGKDLGISHTDVTELPKGLVVPGSLWAEFSKLTALPKGISIGEDLDISHTDITELPKGLVIPDSLWAGGSKLTTIPDDLIVGDYLNIRCKKVSSLPKSVKIGRSVSFLENFTGTKEYEQLKPGYCAERGYLYADDILTLVSKVRQIKGYTYYVGKFKGRDVISDGTNYAHCENFKEGILDLEFKKAKDRGAEQYRSLTLDSVLSLDDAKQMYRIITGSCKQGTEDFAASLGNKLQQQYTVREMLAVTKNQYGYSSFEKFFA